MNAEEALLPQTDLSAVDEDLLITTSGEQRLRGGECERCQRRFFPHQSHCPYCATVAPRAIALPEKGVLYSYVTVFVSSSRPVPYTLGYVDLEGDVRVLANISADAGLRADMPVRLSVTSASDWSFTP